MSIVIFFLVGTVAPFAIWMGIYIALHQNIFTPHSMFRVMRMWRWISWSAAVSLGACSFVFHINWLYCMSASMFSLGLLFPERWLKAQLSSFDLTIAPKHQV